MKDDLFDSEQKKQDAIAALTSLLSHEGWKLLQKMLDKNIEVLVMQLENGVDEETKADIDRVRDKLRLTKEFRTTPEDTISKLEAPDTEPDTLDPFDDVSDVEERKEAELDTEAQE